MDDFKMTLAVDRPVFQLYADARRTHITCSAAEAEDLLVGERILLVTTGVTDEERLALGIDDIFLAPGGDAILSVKPAGLWVHIDETKPWLVVMFAGEGSHVYRMHSNGVSAAMLGSLGRRLMAEEDVALQIEINSRMQRQATQGIVLASPNMRPGRPLG